MKSLIAFSLIIALASAAYTPSWTQCGDKNDDFTPKNVIVQQDPKTENNTLIAACGSINSRDWFTVFDYLVVNGTDGQMGWATRVPYQHVAVTNSNFCLNFTSPLNNPDKHDIPLRITAFNLAKNEAGCVDIVLKYSDSKFLFKRV